MKKIVQLNQSILAGAFGLLFLAGIVQANSDTNAQQLYQENCGSCHGADYGGFLAPALNSETLAGRSPTALRSLIMVGSFETLMPPFYGRLSDQEIRRAYSETEVQEGSEVRLEREESSLSNGYHNVRVSRNGTGCSSDRIE